PLLLIASAGGWMGCTQVMPSGLGLKFSQKGVEIPVNEGEVPGDAGDSGDSSDSDDSSEPSKPDEESTSPEESTAPSDAEGPGEPVPPGESPSDSGENPEDSIGACYRRTQLDQEEDHRENTGFPEDLAITDLQF